MPSSGAKTPQEAMDSLAAAQDEVLERLERAGVQGECGPKLNPKTSAEEWYEKAKEDGNIAPQRKLANEKPKGETVDYDTLIRAGRRRRPSAPDQPGGGFGPRPSHAGCRHAGWPHPRPRPGHHLDPRHPVRRRTLTPRAMAQQEFAAALSRPRLGGARAGGDLATTLAGGAARGAGAGRASGRATSPASASPTSARRRWCGTAPAAGRSTAPSSGRTAAPPTPARALREARP